MKLLGCFFKKASMGLRGLCRGPQGWARFEIGVGGDGWALRRCLRIGSGMRRSSAMMTRFGRGRVFDGFSGNRKTCT